MNWISLYFKHLVMLSAVLIMDTCCKNDRRSTFPSYSGDWTEECRFFPSFTIPYKVDILVTSPRPSAEEYGEPIPNAQVTCKVIKVQRLPHPNLPDTCVWTSFVDQTFTGFTGEDGTFVESFIYTYSSVGDYFILEVSTEKEGYYPDLFSADERWFDYRQRVRSNDYAYFTGERDLLYLTEIKVKNDNP